MALLLVGRTGVRLVHGTRRAMAARTPSDTLDAMGRAVADTLAETGRTDAGAGALAETGRTDAGAGADRVRVLPQPDGYHRCLPDGASEADASRVRGCDGRCPRSTLGARWVIGRPVLDESPTLGGAVRVLGAGVAGRAAPGRMVYHAVPDLLAGSKERVAAFERAWGRWVSPGQRAVRATDPEGAGILAAHRGEDPFRTETQLRTLWT